VSRKIMRVASNFFSSFPRVMSPRIALC
jgi:hypothetical protein